MAKKSFKLSGPTGVVALIAVIGLVGFRVSTLQNISDPKLRADLVLQLSEGSENKFINALEEGRKRGNYSNMSSEIERLKEPIIIHQVKASTKLLEWKNSAEVVVKVEYSDRERPSGRETRYLRYKKGSLGSWQFIGYSTVVNYYLNFF